MKSKHAECKDCPLYNRPGPVSSYFAGDKVDVVFVFISPGYGAYGGECLHDPLRSSVRDIGLTSYGIVDAWRCVLNGSLKDTSNGERHVYSHCLKRLKSELAIHQPKLLVSVGAAATEVLTYRPCSAFSHPGEVGTAERIGDFRMMPMIYPTKARKYWGAWSTGFDKLKEEAQ